jgi:hypothetical protein
MAVETAPTEYEVGLRRLTFNLRRQVLQEVGAISIADVFHKFGESQICFWGVTPGQEAGYICSPMKTYRHLYPQVHDFENLYLAYRKARKGKRRKAPAAAFERASGQT